MFRLHPEYRIPFVILILILLALTFLASTIRPASAFTPQLEVSTAKVIILDSRGNVLQDPTAEPPSAPVTPAPVSDLSNTVLTDIETWLGTYGALTGAAVLFLVGLLKNVPFLATLNPRYLNIGVSSVVVVILLLATNFGYGGQATVVLDALPRIGEIILGILATFGFSTSFHEAAKVYGVSGKFKT